MGFITIQTVMCMKVIGIETYNMETEVYSMQMETAIKVNGGIVKCMDRESTLTMKTEHYSKENGKMVKRLVSDSLHSKMYMGIQVNGDKIKSKAKEHICIPMVTSMREIGCKIGNMVKDSIYTVMEISIEGRGKKIFVMVEGL